MALQHLLDALERNAREEAERTLAQARAECGRLTRQTETDTAARRAQALAARERELEATAARTLGTVRRESRRAVLEARQGLLDRVRTTAQHRAVLAARDAGPLRARVQIALACLGDAAVVICCDRRLAPMVRQAVARRPGTRVETRGADAGAVLVRAADGTVEVDASLAALLDRRWPWLAVDLIKTLEGES